MITLAVTLLRMAGCNNQCHLCSGGGCAQCGWSGNCRDPHT